MRFTVPYYVEIRKRQSIMPNIALVPQSSRLSPVQWTICAVAAVGFAFDTYALLVLPLIVRPALLEIGKMRPGTPEFNAWVGWLFYLPAVAGGGFALPCSSFSLSPWPSPH